MDTSQNMLHVCSPHVSEDVGVETWIRVHVVVPGTSIFVHMHEHVWTRGCSRDEGGGQKYLSASRARAERCDSVAFAMRGVVGLWRVAGGHMGSTRASRWGVAVQEVRRTTLER